MQSVLNVGGGSKSIAIPAYYSGWKHDLLDINPRLKPDILLDARELRQLPGGTYDAVYCAHNLEHYHRPDGARVLEGFAHVLKDSGFAEIRVPDIMAVIRHVAENNLDIDDTLYDSRYGPITVRDVLYGHRLEIEKLGDDHYLHKTGFSAASMKNFVAGRGFQTCVLGSHGQFELTAYLFKTPPTPDLCKKLKVAPAPTA